MFLVKVRTNFCAALRLYRPELTDAENFDLYGICSNPGGHGHNFDLEVAVAGELDPVTGMVTNFYELDRLMKEEIFKRVDHRNLNTEVDFLAGVVPTTENLAAKFWDLLASKISQGRLYSITIGERDTNIVVYYGPGGALPGNH